MKYLFLVPALLTWSIAMGQMPYNPDANGDDLIGSEDLISFLGLYNTVMVDTALTCDYEGTEFESWVGGVIDQTLILDSVYVEYLLIDSVETFLPGCPDPVQLETVLNRAYMISQFYQFGPYGSLSGSISYLSHQRYFFLIFYQDEGAYNLFLQDDEISELTNFSAWSYWNSEAPGGQNNDAFLPFPVNWDLDENGIQVDWSEEEWVGNCENFRLIPFWHEAE